MGGASRAPSPGFIPQYRPAVPAFHQSRFQAGQPAIGIHAGIDRLLRETSRPAQGGPAQRLNPERDAPCGCASEAPKTAAGNMELPEARIAATPSRDDFSIPRRRKLHIMEQKDFQSAFIVKAPGEGGRTGMEIDSRFQIPDSRIQIPDSRIQIPDSGFPICRRHRNLMRSESRSG